MKFKKMIAVLLAVSTLFAFAVPAYAEEAFSEKDIVTETAPRRIYIHYTKTIVREYTTLKQVPETIKYEEYDTKTSAWFSGTLELQSVVKKNGFFYATFTGELYGNA